MWLRLLIADLRQTISNIGAPFCKEDAPKLYNDRNVPGGTFFLWLPPLRGFVGRTPAPGDIFPLSPVSSGTRPLLWTCPGALPLPFRSRLRPKARLVQLIHLITIYDQSSHIFLLLIVISF